MAELSKRIGNLPPTGPPLTDAERVAGIEELFNRVKARQTAAEGPNVAAHAAEGFTVPVFPGG